MKVGKLITIEGIEINLDSSKLGELTELLHHQEVNKAIASEPNTVPAAPGVVDLEDFERTAQAAYLVHQARTFPPQLARIY